MKYILIIFILGLSNQVIGQNWIQNDSKWIYSGATYGGTSYNKFVMEGDTVFEDKNCFKIFREDVFVGFSDYDDIIDTVTNSKKYFGLICEDNDSIFFKYPDSEMSMIFDFNMEVGDSITFNVEGCEENSLVLNLVKLETNIENLRSQKFIVGNSIDFFLQDTITILEGVGLLDDIHGGDHPFQYGILDCIIYNPLFKLNCFISSEFEYPMNNSCLSNFELITGIQKNSVENLYFYPNPTNGLIIINRNDRIREIEIYDLNGNRLRIEKSNVEIIDISNFENGIYLLKIVTENKCSIQKIIKKGT